MYVLHVRLIEANDIPKMDLITQTDAYCIFRSGSETRRSFTVLNSKYPRWNQEFHFTVSSPITGSLNITMRDKDVFIDDNISYIDIPYNTIPVGQVIDQWFNMIPFRRARKGGRLHLMLHMAPAGQPPFVPSNAVYPTYPAPVYPTQPVYMVPVIPYQPQPVYATPVYPQQPVYIQQVYPPPGYIGQPPLYYQGY